MSLQVLGRGSRVTGGAIPITMPRRSASGTATTEQGAPARVKPRSVASRQVNDVGMASVEPTSIQDGATASTADGLIVVVVGATVVVVVVVVGGPTVTACRCSDGSGPDPSGSTHSPISIGPVIPRRTSTTTVRSGRTPPRIEVSWERIDSMASAASPATNAGSRVNSNRPVVRAGRAISTHGFPSSRRWRVPSPVSPQVAVMAGGVGPRAMLPYSSHCPTPKKSTSRMRALVSVNGTVTSTAMVASVPRTASTVWSRERIR